MDETSFFLYLSLLVSPVGPTGGDPNDQGTAVGCCSSIRLSGHKTNAGPLSQGACICFLRLVFTRSPVTASAGEAAVTEVSG